VKTIIIIFSLFLLHRWQWECVLQFSVIFYCTWSHATSLPSIFSSCEFSQNDFYNHYAHSCMHVCAHRFSKCRFRMCIAKIVEYVLVVCRPLLSDQRIVLWIKAITVSTTVLNHRSLFIYFTIFYPYSLIYLNCFVSLGYQGLCFQQNVGYWFSYGYIRGYFDATSSIPSSGE